MNFSDFGFSESILSVLHEEGYETPTPIQAAAIPWILAGQDVLGCAQTGTGKTAAFVLPMVELYAESRARARMPRGLILTPTRELALQVHNNFQKYARKTNLRMALLIGGTSMNEQNTALQRGADMIIATPGRFLDHIAQGNLILTDIKILVIDEADRMLDMGFIPDLKKIVTALPPLRQTLMFSATMPAPIRDLAAEFLSRPKEVIVSAPAQTSTNVMQRYIMISGDKEVSIRAHKRAALRLLLGQQNVENAIIFCNRKTHITELCASLRKHSFQAKPLHGDLSQEERFETLEAFRAGGIPILVASDVAGRGLDVEGLSHVFNFDVPTQGDEYVHRIGRTGRAGRQGTAYTLVSQAEMKQFKVIMELIQKDIQEEVLEGLSFEKSSREKTSSSQEALTTKEASQRKSKSPRGKAVAPRHTQQETPTAPLDHVAQETSPRKRRIRRKTSEEHTPASLTVERGQEIGLDLASTQEPQSQPPEDAHSNGSPEKRNRRRRRGSRKPKLDRKAVDSLPIPEIAAAPTPPPVTPLDAHVSGGQVRTTRGEKPTPHAQPSGRHPERRRPQADHAHPNITHEGFGDHVPAFMLR